MQQPPESSPATSHCLCPTVALTAALARHCKARVAPARGNDHGLPWCACQHQRPSSPQKPARLALRGHPRQCCSLPTARAASWESSEPGLWGRHPSEGAHIAGDSISVRPLVSAVLSADDLVVLLHSQVTSSAGSSPRPGQQQTEPSTQEKPGSTKQLSLDPPARHCFVTKLFGESESFPAVTAHGSREGKTCCLPHPQPPSLRTLPHLPPPGWRFFFSTLQPT